MFRAAAGYMPTWLTEEVEAEPVAGCLATLTLRLNPNFCLWVFINRATQARSCLFLKLFDIKLGTTHLFSQACTGLL